MPDTIPSSGDRTVVVHRHGVLTWISLAFNALILLLILIGICCHHHHRRHHEYGGWGNHHERQDWGGRGQGHFDRHEWNHASFDGSCDRGPGQDHRGFGMENRPGWGGDRAAFGGWNHSKPTTPPSAEAMTDRFMLILTQKLTLTDPESAQIRPVIQQSISQFQKDMEAQKQAHQKMIDDAKAKIRAALNADQQKQFDQMTASLGTPAPAKPAPATK